MNNNRLEQQIHFILELDRLKKVLRRTYLLDEQRAENSAEHSWHLATMALVLGEHAPQPLNLLHVLKMLLIHDVVEIDAGDTFLYDPAAQAGKLAREQAAAQRIFRMLPSDQADEMLNLWQEFEARETPEAKFAAGLDRLMPLLHNYFSHGRSSWQANQITAEQVLLYQRWIAEAAPALGDYARRLVEDAVTQGYLHVSTATTQPLPDDRTGR